MAQSGWFREPPTGWGLSYIAPAASFSSLQSTQFIECIHQVRLPLGLLGVQGGAGAFAHHVSFSVAQPGQGCRSVQYRACMRGSDMDLIATSIGDF
jgi:hypothetical protein